MSDSQLVRCNTPDDYHRLLMRGLFPAQGPVRVPEWVPHGVITADLIEGVLGLSESEEEEELLEAIKQHCRQQRYPMIVEYGCQAKAGYDYHVWIHQHYLDDILDVDTLLEN